MLSVSPVFSRSSACFALGLSDSPSAISSPFFSDSLVTSPAPFGLGELGHRVQQAEVADARALPNFAALPNAARVTSVAFATPLLKFSEVAGSEASAFVSDDSDAFSCFAVGAPP